MTKQIKRLLAVFVIVQVSLTACSSHSDTVTGSTGTDLPDVSGYPVVGTNQTTFFDNYGEIAEPAPGEAFYGQDAHYGGTTPQYVDNGDGTITDMVTGLMWEQGFIERR